MQGDTDPPVVTGSPTTSANGNGWYRGNVRIDWSATDTGSGVATQPADTVVTEQGSTVTAQSPQVCDTGTDAELRDRQRDRAEDRQDRAVVGGRAG